MLCITRYPDSHKEDVHKFYFPWSRFINSSSKVWFILPLTGILWKNSELFFPVLSPSNQNSAFWRFLPYCSLGLFSLLHSKSRSRQSPGELSFFQPLECLKTSCWFHMLKKKKKKRSREDGNGMALFVTFWHPLKWTVRSYGSDWLGDDVIHITVWNSATKNTVGDRKGTYRFDFGWFRPEAAH